MHQLLQFMIQSNSLHMESGDSQMKELYPGEILQQPLIILSSNSDDELFPDLQIPLEDPFEEVVIQRKRETELQRQKRINSVKNIWDEVQQQQKRELDDLRNNPPRKSGSQVNRTRQIQLRKEFEGYKYLPAEALEFVKDKMERFSSYTKCQFEKTNNQSEQHIRYRQQHRQNLTKVILLAREELKLITEQKDEFEDQLCKDSYDVLAYAYRVASQIELTFFKELYKKKQLKKGEAYTKQIKLVLRQFSDKNNLNFRRGILSRRYPYKMLAGASQEILMCQKTRQEREEKIKQLIRQNEKIEPNQSMAIEDQAVEISAEMIKGYDSIKSRSDFYEGKVEVVEDKKKKEKEDLIAKNKIICKKTYKSIIQSMRSMQVRIEKLKTSRTRGSIFQGLGSGVNVRSGQQMVAE